MTSQPPAPGRDEITLSAPAADLCISLQNYGESRPAHVAVTFGEPGTRYPGALWPDCWHHTYPRCAACWQATRHVAQARRPGPVVTDTTPAPT